MDFFTKYQKLCKMEGSTPTGTALQLGISRAAVNRWRNGTIPSGEILTIIANHFNVTVDSMSPLIENGNMILLRRQESIDSGQIAVVLIDGEEASVKRVIYGDKWIELQSVNPYYPPRRFEGADVQRLRVMGIVKKVSKDIC